MIENTKHASECRVLVVADLHADLWWPRDRSLFDHVELEALDGLILAGDVCDDLHRKSAGILVPMRDRLPEHAFFGVVPGNHDYYNGPLDDEARMRAAVEAAGATWMQEFDGVLGTSRVLACTLWASMEGRGAMELDWIWEEMKDYREIYMMHDRMRPIFPQDTIEVHKAHLSWLNERMSHAPTEGFERTIVITHHAPSRRALTQKRRQNYLGAAYASDLEDAIDWSSIDLWLYGHTHHYTTFDVGGTICQNVSLGYPREYGIPGPRLTELVFDFGAVS